MENRKTGGKPERNVVRVRHPVKFRLLQVKSVKTLAPNFLRITFAGDDLHDFVSASFDDHIKVFFPNPGEDMPKLPTQGPDGPLFAGEKPVMRDFTPRRFDQQARELDIEFALHEAGPATTWAAQAKVGQYLGVGGPRGSMIIPMDFDWHLLIGDETALPAVARRLEELPEQAQAIVVLEVANAQERIEFHTKARADIQWCYRDATGNYGEALLEALKRLPIPEDDGYVWAAGEAAAMRAARQFLVTERGVDKSRIRAASYWKRGAQGVHENIGDE
jgi:NADPH-dependent ferric siderophore reductase